MVTISIESCLLVEWNKKFLKVLDVGIFLCWNMMLEMSVFMIIQLCSSFLVSFYGAVFCYNKVGLGLA